MKEKRNNKTRELSVAERSEPTQTEGEDKEKEVKLTKDTDSKTSVCKILRYIYFFSPFI